MSFPLVQVEWEDITNAAYWSEYMNVYEWKEFEFDHMCSSVGYLIKDTPDYIILSAQITKDSKNLAMATRIPKGVIKSIMKLTSDGIFHDNRQD